MKSPTQKISSFILLVILLSIAGSVNASIAGNALQFDGVNDFSTIADAPHLRFSSTDSFTIEFWFNPTVTNRDQQVMLGKRSATTASGPSCTFRLDTNKARYVTRDDTGTKVALYPGTTIIANNWYHMAVVKDASLGQTSAYINGVLKSSRNDTDSGVTTSMDMTLGKSYFAIPYHFKGMMDELRIWNTALDGTYIADNRDLIISDPTSYDNLIGYYNFDEAFGEQYIYDSSTKQNQGLMGGSLSTNSYDPTRVFSTAPLVVPEPASVCIILMGVVGLRKRFRG